MSGRASRRLRTAADDWHRARVVVRGEGNIERVVVITEHARMEVDRYLAAYADGKAGRWPSLGPLARCTVGAIFRGDGAADSAPDPIVVSFASCRPEYSVEGRQHEPLKRIVVRAMIFVEDVVELAGDPGLDVVKFASAALVVAPALAGCRGRGHRPAYHRMPKNSR